MGKGGGEEGEGGWKEGESKNERERGRREKEREEKDLKGMYMYIQSCKPDQQRGEHLRTSFLYKYLQPLFLCSGEGLTTWRLERVVCVHGRGNSNVR